MVSNFVAHSLTSSFALEFIISVPTESLLHYLALSNLSRARTAQAAINSSAKSANSPAIIISFDGMLVAHLIQCFTRVTKHRL